MSEAQLSNETYSSYARLLGKENFAVEFSKSVTTAYFDVKNRKLMFPVWNVSHDVMVLLSSHEVGHAVYTYWNLLERFYEGYSKVEQRVLSNVFNVVEDARIEKLMKRRYPGIEVSHQRGYMALFNKEFFGSKEVLVNELNGFNFLDRANVYFKLQTNGVAKDRIQVSFTPEEAGYIEAIKDANSMDEALRLTAAIYENLMEAPSEPPSEPKGSISSKDFTNEEQEEQNEAQSSVSGSTEESEEDEDEDEESSGSGESDEESDEDSEESSASSDEEDEDAEENGAGNGSSDGTNEGGSSDDEAEEDEDDEDDGYDEEEDSGEVQPEYDDTVLDYSIDDTAGRQGRTAPGSSFTAESLEENLAKTVNTERYGDRRATVVVPRDHSFKASAEIDRGPDRRQVRLRNDHKYRKMIQKVKKSATHMANEFAVRKSAHNRKMTRKTKTGQLDTKNLPQYKFSDDMFRKRKTKPRQTNHGMIVVVDCSMSMSGELFDTAQQIALCVEFAKKTGVKLEVWGFTSSTDRDKACTLYAITSSETRSLDKDLARMVGDVEDRSHRIRLNYTPLAMSMLSMAEVAEDFKTRHRVEKFTTVVLTDGGDNSIMELPGYPARKEFNGKLYDERTKTLVNCESSQVEGAFRYYKNRVGGRLVHIFLDRTFTNVRFSVPTTLVQKEKWAALFAPLDRFETVVDKMLGVKATSHQRTSQQSVDVTSPDFNPELADPKEVANQMQKDSKAPKIFLDELVNTIS